MDPEACLLAAETAWNDAEFDLFLDAMATYADWRRKGGFEPTLNVETLGDVFYGILSTQYGALVGNTEAIPKL